MLAYLGWTLARSAVTRFRQRNALDGSIDDRAKKHIDTLITSLNDERAAHGRTRALYEQLAENFSETIRGELTRQSNSLREVHEEWRKSTNRLHERIDLCERRHAERDVRDARRDQLFAAMAEKLGMTEFQPP